MSQRFRETVGVLEAQLDKDRVEIAKAISEINKRVDIKLPDEYWQHVSAIGRAIEGLGQRPHELIVPDQWRQDAERHIGQLVEAIQTAGVGQKGSDENGFREALVKALDQLTEAVKSQQGKGEIQVTATLPEEIARLVAERTKIAEEKKDTRREQSPVPRAQR